MTVNFPSKLNSRDNYWPELITKPHNPSVCRPVLHIHTHAYRQTDRQTDGQHRGYSPKYSLSAVKLI